MKTRNGFVSNSSTSSFVCNVKMTSDELEEKLRLLVKFYNEFTGQERVFEDMFEPPFVGSKETVEYLGFDEDKCLGKLIVMGVGDNSVPYELHEFIEEALNAVRYHI